MTEETKTVSTKKTVLVAEVPEFQDYKGTDDWKLWKSLKLKLCSKCNHKPLTDDANNFVCANGLPECEGVKMWENDRLSAKEKDEY